MIANLGAVRPGGRNTALNRAAWGLAAWIALGALDQGEVEDQLFNAARKNDLVADDCERQTWATIRSGIDAGLRAPIQKDWPMLDDSLRTAAL